MVGCACAGDYYVFVQGICPPLGLVAPRIPSAGSVRGRRVVRAPVTIVTGRIST